MSNMRTELDLSNCDLCTCMNLRKASRAITQYYDRMLQPTGLRATQFTILVVTATAGSITITKLAKRLVMDRTTLTRNLRPLEKQGLIKISAGEDQRTRCLTLSPNGRKKLAKALPLWEKAQQHFEKGLGQARFQNLLSNLSETIDIALDRNLIGQ